MSNYSLLVAPLSCRDILWAHVTGEPCAEASITKDLLLCTRFVSLVLLLRVPNISQGSALGWFTCRKREHVTLSSPLRKRESSSRKVSRKPLLSRPPHPELGHTHAPPTTEIQDYAHRPGAEGEVSPAQPAGPRMETAWIPREKYGCWVTMGNNNVDRLRQSICIHKLMSFDEPAPPPRY